jgi:hypothetical protein
VAQRIKGQEATVIITRGGQTEDTLNAIKNLNVEFQGEIKSQGYLGEKTNRQDDVFNGVKFDYEIDTSSQDWLNFVVAIHDRMKRNNPTLVINVTASLLYPNLDNPDIFLPDAKFGPIGMTIGGRTDYIGKKFQGACDDYDVQLS